MKAVKVIGAIVGIIVGAVLLIQFFVIRPRHEEFVREERARAERRRLEAVQEDQREEQWSRRATERNAQVGPTAPVHTSGASGPMNVLACQARCAASSSRCSATCTDEACRVDCLATNAECVGGCGTSE